MKKVFLGLIIAITGLFAIQDGNYKCVSYKIVKKDTSYKLPEKDMKIVLFKVTKSGREVSDGEKTFKYMYSYKNIDIFKNGDMLISLPTDDVKDGYFGAALMKNGENFAISLACKKY